jgi:hypothetical protein
MRKYYKIIIIISLTAVLFVPFYPVTVVPEWELRFVNKDGTPASSIRIDQIWQHYSLEWMSGGSSDRNLQTDSNGFIKLPARRIQVSIFQVLSSHVRDAIMSINPHASFGADSFINCAGTENCTVSYKESNEKPQRVVLW